MEVNFSYTKILMLFFGVGQVMVKTFLLLLSIFFYKSKLNLHSTVQCKTMGIFFKNLYFSPYNLFSNSIFHFFSTFFSYFTFFVVTTNNHIFFTNHIKTFFLWGGVEKLTPLQLIDMHIFKAEEQIELKLKDEPSGSSRKNLGVQHIIKPRRNLSRTFLSARWSKLSARWSKLSARWSKLSARGSELSARWSKMSAKTILRGVMIWCTPRFFHRRAGRTSRNSQGIYYRQQRETSVK